MSKTFSKILVICAMVAILPLLVVGTAFAAYNSIDNVVTIQVVVDHVVNEQYTQSENAKETYLKVRGENQKFGDLNSSLAISKAHNKSSYVEAYYSSDAYTFKGWFKGDKQAYQNALAKGNVELVPDSKLTFSMSGEKNYVAVYAINTFEVTYKYAPQPEQEEITQAPADFDNVFEYGEALPTLVPDAAHKDTWDFVDWTVNDANYVFADFEKAESYELVAHWREKSKSTLTFQLGDKTVSKDLVRESNYTIPSIDELFADETELLAEYKEAGYSYEWTLDGKSINTSEFKVPQEDATLVYTKTLINYEATLKVDDGVLAEGVVPQAVTFNVNSTNVFDDWFNLDTKYIFENITGIKYQEETYTKSTIDQFIAKYVDENKYSKPTENAELELVVESEITSIRTTEAMKYTFGTFLDSEEFDEKDAKVTIYNSTGTVDFAEDLGVNSVTLDLSIAKFLKMEDSGEIAKRYRGANKTQEVELAGIWVDALIPNSHSQLMIKFDEKLTLNSSVKDLVQIIIQRLQGNGHPYSAPENGIFQIKTVTLCFVDKAN